MIKDLFSSLVFVFILSSFFFFWDQKTDKELIKSNFVCITTTDSELGDENFIFAATDKAYSKVLRPDGVETLETLSCQKADNYKVIGYYPLDVNKKIFMLNYHKIIYVNLDKEVKMINAEEALQQLSQKGLKYGDT
jgi:hypothetical protein